MKIVRREGTNVALDALWTAEFQVTGGWTNGGVVILENGRLFGGDGQYYYAGRLSLDPDSKSVSGHVKVVHYHGDRTTAFGDAGPEFSLDLQGTVLSHKAISGVLKRPGYINLAFRLARREDLA